MPSAGFKSRQHDRDAELRIVMRAGALDLAIGRRRQALPCAHSCSMVLGSRSGRIGLRIRSLQLRSTNCAAAA